MQVVESRAGRLHMLLNGDARMACGRAGGDWQVVMGRRLRAVPFCRLCLREVQRRVKAESHAQ